MNVFREGTAARSRLFGSVVASTALLLLSRVRRRRRGALP